MGWLKALWMLETQHQGTKEMKCFNNYADTILLPKSFHLDRTMEEAFCLQKVQLQKNPNGSILRYLFGNPAKPGETSEK